MPMILAVSVIMILSNTNVHVFGQANQTSTTSNQTSPQANQTSTSQNSTSMNEKLLNYTSEAIKAQKKGDKSMVTDNLKLLQESLINASGKKLVVVPDITSSDSSSKDKSSSSKDKSSSSKDKTSSSKDKTTNSTSK